MMKKITLLIIAAVALALSACENENNEPGYGKIEYDGKICNINSVNYEIIETFGISGSPPCRFISLASKEKNSSDPRTKFSINLRLENDPRIDFEFIMNDFTIMTFSFDDTYFFHNGFYATITHTGEVVLSLEKSGITGGRVKWTAGKDSANIQFDITFTDGKTARGNATIPYSVFEKSH